MPLAFRGSQNALQALVRSAFFIAASLLLPATSIQAGDSCAPSGKLEQVSVSYVYDGDTLRLEDGRKLRLIGVNTTELGHGEKPDQPLARLARSTAQSFVDDSEQLLIQTDQQLKDRYGRLLAHLFNDRGDNLEQQLLDQGLAYHVAVPPNLTLSDCLARAEQRAHAAQSGLWGPPGIAPITAANVTTGGFQRVRGTVTGLKLGKAWRLTLDSNLVAITYPENRHHFDRDWYESLSGRYIEVQGWVYHSRGEWRIKLETPYGLDLP